MAELPSDPTGTGLPLDPYGGRGCCGYSNGPVLQHRLHQFLDDQRCTIPGHYPQVLEFFGSSERKWCISCPLRDSLLDRGERRLHPGQPHWGVGFRSRIAACKPARDHRFPRVERQYNSQVNVDSRGVILKGYDAVAYFKQGKPVKRDPKITSSHQGATYLFASAEDKGEFDKDPAKYVPQYGGFCAY